MASCYHQLRRHQGWERDLEQILPWRLQKEHGPADPVISHFLHPEP